MTLVLSGRPMEFQALSSTPEFARLRRMDDREGGDGTHSYGSPESAPISHVPEEIAEDILSYVREELARFGASGEPFIEYGLVILRTQSRTSQTQLGPWAPRWLQLDEPSRRLRAAQIARALARPSGRPSLAPHRRRYDVAPFVWLACLGAVGAGGYAYLQSEGAPAATVARGASGDLGAQVAEQDPATTGREPREARAERVCEATRARVVRGATVTLADSEGWVVEFMGFSEGSRDPLHTHEALKEFFSDPSNPDGSSYKWKAEPQLSLVDTSTSRVKVSRAVIDGTDAAPIEGIAISFEGALVDAFFQEEARGKYFHIASALSKELNLTHAGLYARCQSGDTHHIGAWFHGTSDANALVSLMYLLGTYASPLHLAPPYYHPVGEKGLNRAFAFASIEKVAVHVDRPLLSSLLGQEGGMITGMKDSASTMTFSFKDANRASRVSREIARLTSIGGQ